MKNNKGRSSCTVLKESLAALTTESRLAGDFKFAEVALGYAGVTSAGLTLNSRFFSLYLTELPGEEEAILFPQRVPRSGFFDEIKSVAPGEVSSRIRKIQNTFLDFQNNFFIDKDISGNFDLEVLNHLKASLRLGVCPDKEPVCGLQGIHSDYHLTVIDLLINRSVSSELPVPMELLTQALELSLEKNRSTIINRIIVAASRYEKTFFEKESVLLKSLTQELMREIENFKITSSFSKIQLATFCRGIPMSPYFPEERTEDYLRNAESLLLSIKPINEREAIVRDENLFTLYLTFSKFHLYQKNNVPEFLTCMEKMMTIDPHDSTAPGELGLFYFRKENYTEAEKFFRKCTQMGPPSLAMNLYFLGECLEKRGELEEAIRTYEECTSYDPEGLSPVLRLYEIKKEIHPKEAELIRDLILKNPSLNDQLTEEERCALMAY